MNTYLWGPQLWRVLHTVSFYPPTITETQQHNYSVNLLLLLTSLQRVLPCKFCRESYIKYYWDLPSLIPFGILATEERSVEWVYQLHNLVNKKLNTECTIIPRHCLEKRHRLHPLMCSEQDVWDILSMMALNFKNYTDTENAGLTEALGVFIWCLFVLLKCHGASWAADTVDFCLTSPPVFTSRAQFIYWIETKTKFQINPFRFELARAKKCQDKSCV